MLDSIHDLAATAAYKFQKVLESCNHVYNYPLPSGGRRKKNYQWIPSKDKKK